MLRTPNLLTPIGRLGLLLALLPAAPAAAQEGEAAARESEVAGAFSDEVSVGVVLVPVVVRGRGGYVRGLDRDDFRLFVDGRPLAVDSFERRAEAPLSLVFLQDLSGSMDNGGKLRASREAVGFFLERTRPGDELAIATFADGALSVEVPFTADLPALSEAVAAWEAYGVTALHDAVARLPEISAAGRRPKRAAVLLTDGVDNASLLSPADARAVVRRAQVPVYVLGLGSGSPFAAAGGEKLHRYADVLNLLAATTGGRYYDLAGPADWKEAVVDIAEDLRNQYVLGFAESGVGRAAYHRLRVEVRGKGYQVVARQGYFGTPPAAWSARH